MSDWRDVGLLASLVILSNGERASTASLVVLKGELESTASLVILEGELEMTCFFSRPLTGER